MLCFARTRTQTHKHKQYLTLGFTHEFLHTQKDYDLRTPPIEKAHSKQFILLSFFASFLCKSKSNQLGLYTRLHVKQANKIVFNVEIPDFFVATNFRFLLLFAWVLCIFSAAVCFFRCATNKEKTLIIQRRCCCCCCCWRFCFIFVQYTQRIIDTIDKYYMCTILLLCRCLSGACLR